uniref:Putative cytochrome n=1 Tax=Panstrongylus lignarius TaxID=156445 RepID=A0A224XM97_9HEMI
MENTEITWILFAVVITLMVYWIMKLMSLHQYWKNCGICYLKPSPIFGNFFPVVSLNKSMGDMYKEAYFHYPNERIVGFYELFKPVLIVRDPKLIEKILVKDFQYFTDHHQISEDQGLLSYGLFQLRGSAWRSVRYKISPAFTSGKLKVMFNGMVDCTDDLIKMIEKNLNKEFDVRNAISKYTIDVIASTVFGIQICNKSALEKFIQMGTSIFNTTPARFVHLIAISQFPKLASWLGFRFIPDENTDYFKELINTTLKQREGGEFHRNDYTQQLLKLKEQNAIEVQSKDADDDYLELNSAAPTENIEITNDLLIGQAFQFLSAGFDPVLAAIMYVMYDLARYPQIQERLRHHVQEVLKEHNEFSYACIKDMTYLEQCIQETLRMHSLAQFLFRECTKKYYLLEERLEIPKGMKVIIPIAALHMDPKYYPDPEVYNPERFPPNVTRQNFTYLPFGDGPRICIGIRYALIVMKIALAKMVANYKFSLSPKTKVPFETNKQSIICLPKTKFLFNFTKA